MLLPALLLALQVAAAPDSVSAARRAAHFDSIAARQAPVYATAALAALVDSASRRNRRVPPALQGYSARVESEMAILGQRAEGQEIAVSLEQTSSRAAWRRSGDYEQHVEGYRSTQISVTPTVMGALRDAWTVPVLYGNRMALLFGVDSGRTSPRARSRPRRRVYWAEHPLGEERDRFYTFAGGDTVTRLRTGGRLVEVVRVRVTPRDGFRRRVVVFAGDVYLDARRLQLVRMRGRFVETGPAEPGRGLPDPVRAFTEALAFVDLENREVNGAWWLPSMQRVEVQVAVPQLGDARSVLRIVSRWRDYAVDATGDAERLAAIARGDTAGLPDPALLAGEDTLATRAHRLTLAPRDSLSAHGAWATELGAETAAVHAEDFLDLAPDRWRPTGAPRLDWRVSRASDLAHFDRVEGAYTGYGAELRLRDRAPGVSLRGNAGYAWGDETVRGRLTIDRTRRGRSVGLRGGRQVDVTNDFRAALDSGNSVAALFGEDAYDYVDRRSVAGYVARRLTPPGRRPLIARLELAAVRDAEMANAMDQAPIAFEGGWYRPNRPVADGGYGRVLAQLELDPDMAAQGLRPGVGALASVEAGRGDLDYMRLEGRIVARRQRGNTMVMLRGDAGALLADRPPPQQLFEMGGRGPVLSGYDYKEFAGDRAALGRLLAMYTFPVLRAPIRLTRTIALPGLSPGVSVGWQSGWASVGDREASAAAVRAMGVRFDPKTGKAVIDPATGLPFPASRPTDGVKSSYDLRLRFFGGTASFGAARAVERGAKWRWVMGVVQEL